MRIAAISDLHGKTGLEGWCNIGPDIDLLTISGDVMISRDQSSRGQETNFVNEIAPWLRNLGIPVVMTFGNHDYIEPEAFRELLDVQGLPDVHLLIDERIEVGGVVFHGFPWTPPFMGWNYNAREYKATEILNGTDLSGVQVLLSHGPPFGYCDRVKGTGEHLGSEALYNAMTFHSVPWVLCGHIHTGSHLVHSIGTTNVVNVSLLNEGYKFAYKPFVFDIGHFNK